MPAPSEEIRYAATVIQYMELCADLPPSLRKTIANSKAYHDLVLSLAQEASAKNVATLKEAYRKCSDAWEEIVEGKRAKKKRKALENNVNPNKRTKTFEDRFASRASSPTDAQTTMHTASVTGSPSAIATTTKPKQKWTTADTKSLALSHDSKALDIVIGKKGSIVGLPEAYLRGVETFFTLPRPHLGIHGDRLFHHNHFPHTDAAETALMSAQDMKRFKEFGITSGNPDILGPIKAHCKRFSGYQKNKFNDVLGVFSKLNFDIAKLKLLGYLNGRPKSVGGASAAASIPQTWHMKKSLDIVHALHIMAKHDDHVKLHRIFAQMKLYHMVSAGLTKGLRAKGAGKHTAEHRIAIEDLAKSQARQQPEAAVDSIEKQYTNAYFAGKRWSELVGWFGGVGIVFIFVTRKISIYFIQSGWNKFHFDCLEYIAGFLPSIKKLVRTMGSDVLEQYCRNGNLPKERVDEIREVKGYC